MKREVYPLTVVDNSVFFPTGLTIPLDLVYPPFNSSTLPVSSSEDADAPSYVVTLARVLPPALPALAVCSSVALPWSCPVERSSEGAHQAPPSAASPRTPDDCPASRLASSPSSVVAPAPPAVRPWGEVKSCRGAPKRVNTEGYACSNHQCPYFGITDAHIHALVGDGKHGHAERIQTFRGPACHTTFSARRHTPLYRLKTPSYQVAMVLAALAEGLDASAAERVFGYRQATITSLSDSRWRTRTDPARVLLPPSPPSAPAAGRTSNQAAQRQACALALAGYRPPLEMYSGPACGSPHTKLSTSGDALSATDPGTWLHPALYQ